MSKPPADASFLHVNLPDSLLKRVDDFRFKNKFQNRTESVKWLLDWALKQKPTPGKEPSEYRAIEVSDDVMNLDPGNPFAEEAPRKRATPKKTARGKKGR